MLPWFQVDEILLRALREDVPYLDLSCEGLFPPSHRSNAYLLAKSEGVLCGAAIFLRTFTLLDPTCAGKILKDDGEAFAPGDRLLTLEGPTAALLQGERTALNLLQHLSGVATATARVCRTVEGTSARVADTRKTLPGLRALQKYAVRCGGGSNHRFSLSDGVMLKDNHIDAAGSIAKAVAAARVHLGHMVKLEVEARTLEEVQDALMAGADVIMLDNMSREQMREAVALVRGSSARRVPLEASGDITEANAAAVAATGVDILSLGALTHSARAANISMKIQTE
ncbi:MAG: carboxylating nicotinate-nucleotide diphosphorylase [Oscillospiraceae bacterium]|jgi:nicotinate-nucleotide pyrophosphorylase (carboxylating)|nr:carboxylating nicotinate-nucleotide diphosphorylase [Oscillospiraceae bacterium]